MQARAYTTLSPNMRTFYIECNIQTVLIIKYRVVSTVISGADAKAHTQERVYPTKYKEATNDGSHVQNFTDDCFFYRLLPVSDWKQNTSLEHLNSDKLMKDFLLWESLLGGERGGTLDTMHGRGRMYDPRPSHPYNPQDKVRRDFDRPGRHR